MTAGDIQKGDKVSWNWGGGAPGGTVAEKKTEGKITITSKRGNKISKNAEPDNPAVHVKRSGNDVVKKESELNVEKKKSGDSAAGEKRKHEEKENGDDQPLVENKDGKEVRPGGKKKSKTDSATGQTQNAKMPKASNTADKGRVTKKKKKESKPRATEGVSSRTRSRK